MPKCKMSNCREEAVPFGKRYCPRHKAEYERKQREYAAIQRTLRDCECCGIKLSKTRHDAGETLCGDCAEVVRKEYAEQRKQRAFDEAATVEELKNWMREHMSI